MSEASSIPKPLWIRLLKGLGISLGALILLIALAPTLMPTGWIRDRIEAEAKAAGIPVTVESVSLGWFSGASLDGVEIANVEGGSDSPLLRIRRLHVDADLLALLSHQVHVRKLSLEDLELSLEQRGKDGLWNIQALAPRPPAADASTPGASSSAPWPIAVDAISLEGKARILARGRTLEIPELKLGGTAPDLLSQPVRLHLKARAASGDADWILEAEVQGAARPASGHVNATLQGKGLSGILAPFLDLPAALSEGDIALEASLDSGRLKADLKRLSLKGLVIGPAVCADAAASFRVEGLFPAGPLALEGSLAAKGAGWSGIRLSECRIEPKASLDPATGNWTLEACSLSAGPLSGTLSGRCEGVRIDLTQTLKGDLAGLDQALTGALPTGSGFTGLLDAALALKVDGPTTSVDGETSLSGFSIRAPDRTAGPKLDLKFSQKVSWDAEAKHLEIGAFHLTTGVGGPLDLSAAGSVQDPARLGELDLTVTAQADLARLQTVLAGYFSALPAASALDCRGRLDAAFRARGSRLEARATLADGRFSGGPFGDPIAIPNGALAADADMVRDDDGARILVRTFKASMPFLSATVTDGMLELPDQGPGQGKASLAVEVSDLDAASRFLSGPVPALRGVALAGKASFHTQGSGPLPGPWTLPSASLILSKFKVSGSSLPGPLALDEAKLDVAGIKASPEGALVRSISFSSPLASLSCGLEASTSSLDLSALKLSADLDKVGALLTSWKLFAPGTPLSGPLSVETASVHLDLVRHALVLAKPLEVTASGVGLDRLSLASLSLGDWNASLATFQSGPLEMDLDAGRAGRLAGIPAKGPVTLRGRAEAKGRGVTVDFTVQAKEMELALPSFRKLAGKPLSLALKGTVEDGVLTCERFDLVFDTLSTGLESGSRIPLDPSKDAKIRLIRTAVALKDLEPYLPQLKGLSGSVSTEGMLEGPLSMPAAQERLRADLSVTLDGVGLTYSGADGQPVPVQANGAIHLTREKFSLKDLVVSLRKEALTVSGEILDPVKIPKGRILVTGGAFDLDRLLKLQPASTGAGAGPSGPTAASKPGPLFPSPFDQADLEVLFQLKELVYKGNKLAALDSRTTLKASRLHSENKATVNEGPVLILVDLDASQKDPPLTAELEAKDVKLDIELPKTVRYFLPVLAGGKGITGKLSLEPLKVEGHGASWEKLRDNIRTVQDGRVHVSSGEVQGAPFLAKMGEVLHKPELGDLKFDAIDAVFRIRDKRLENESTVSSKQGRILSRGWVDFDQTLEQKTTLSGDFLKTGDERWDKGLSIVMERGGVLTDGTIDDPRTHLDMKEILKELGKAALEDILKDRLKGLFGN